MQHKIFNACLHQLLLPCIILSYCLISVYGTFSVQQVNILKQQKNTKRLLAHQQQNQYHHQQIQHHAPKNRRKLLFKICNNGEVNRPNSANCAECQPGFYSDNSSTWQWEPECKVCPEGYYTDQAQQAECTGCTAGN